VLARERLFDRLSFLDLSDDQKRVKKNSDRVYDSIHHHLHGLFNTLRGTVPTDPDYGIPDLSMGPGSSQVHGSDLIAQVMLETLHRYEQRLTKPQVEVSLNGADNLSIRFVIKATIELLNETREVSFAGTILANGSFVLDNND